MEDFTEKRRDMVETQIRARGVRDQHVLDAMTAVPREEFVQPRDRSHSYEDRPLPIGCDQTISQPYVVALMIEAMELKGGETVLEIGAGCGYAAAVLAQIAGKVFAVERIGELAESAAATLAAIGSGNVEVIHGDGTEGLADAAPFDAILVSAGAAHIPDALKEQLRDGGRMVIPVDSVFGVQTLVKITRKGKTFDREKLGDVRFVPLIGSIG